MSKLVETFATGEVRRLASPADTSPVIWIPREALSAGEDAEDGGPRNNHFAYVSYGVVEFDDGPQGERERRARLFGAVSDVVDDLGTAPDDGERSVPYNHEMDRFMWDSGNPTSFLKVPLPVALAGRPVISAYLEAHGVSREEVARMLGVSTSTVRQYISDVRTGRRVK